MLSGHLSSSFVVFPCHFLGDVSDYRLRVEFGVNGFMDQDDLAIMGPTSQQISEAGDFARSTTTSSNNLKL